jgi:hypothetical protein
MKPHTKSRATRGLIRTENFRYAANLDSASWNWEPQLLNGALNMQKAILILVAAAVSSVMASLESFGSAAEPLNQKLVVGGIAATVSVINPGNGIVVQAEFQSSTYPVGCLSAYRDLRYDLRAGDGRLISVNQETLQHPPYEGPQTLNHVVSSSSKGPVGCAANAVNGTWRPHAQFATLYPNLPPGKYTLRISFVPHGTGQHADFAPVPIFIAPSPQAT